MTGKSHESNVGHMTVIFSHMIVDCFIYSLYDLQILVWYLQCGHMTIKQRSHDCITSINQLISFHHIWRTQQCKHIYLTDKMVNNSYKTVHLA